MKTRAFSIAFLLIVVLLFGGMTFAMRSTNFAITRDLFSGSVGGTMTSASYRVDGTLGQAIIGLSSSEHYQINAGYWFDEIESSAHLVYLPFITR